MRTTCYLFQIVVLVCTKHLSTYIGCSVCALHYCPDQQNLLDGSQDCWYILWIWYVYTTYLSTSMSSWHYILLYTLLQSFGPSVLYFSQETFATLYSLSMSPKSQWPSFHHWPLLYFLFTYFISSVSKTTVIFTYLCL